MKVLRKSILPVLVTYASVLFCITPTVLSHCEIPCGIYNDAMRLDMIAEDIDTIEKSMKEINELAKAGEKNYNQLVRWVMNKEHHADYLCDTVTEYFMKQRIAPVESTDKAYQDYVNKLILLHKLMVYSMKCKQTADLDNVAKLREYLQEFRAAYLGTANPVVDTGHGHVN
jgi:nickel superoxide dismutase